MAVCQQCKYRRDSTTQVVGYGELPDWRCVKNGGTKGKRAVAVRKDGGKRKPGGRCDFFKPLTGN